jgi:hypothetical protein
LSAGIASISEFCFGASGHVAVGVYGVSPEDVQYRTLSESLSNIKVLPAVANLGVSPFPAESEHFVKLSQKKFNSRLVAPGLSSTCFGPTTPERIRADHSATSPASCRRKDALLDQPSAHFNAVLVTDVKQGHGHPANVGTADPVHALG